MGHRSRRRGEARSATNGVSLEGGSGSSDGGQERAMPGPGSRQEEGAGWPAWARAVVTVVLLFHLAAVLAGAVGMPPSSELERAIADGFTSYFDVMDTGHSYRFYVEPPPTPVVTATIRYEDGRPEETVRLPGRAVAGPRMRYQRQLQLADALYRDVQEARQWQNDAGRSRLARSYARHLCRTRPGCRSVTLHVEQHLIPDLAQVRQALTATGASRVDLFADRWFTTPEWIGDFSCDDF
jgi:hypothetical protein